MIPSLYITELSGDPMVRENFRLISEYLKDTDILRGEFKHYELVFSSAVTGFLLYHRLGFTPKDLIQTFVSNGASITYSYDDFNSDTIKFNVDSACRLRMFLGRYRKKVEGS